MHQIEGGALAHRFERNLAIEPSDGPLRDPQRGGQGCRSLAKRGRTEEMVYQPDKSRSLPQRRVERRLVEILDHDVVIPRCELPAVVAAGEKRIRVTRANAGNVDP